MSKGPEAFRTISEVAEELNIPQHVLRFWETRFTQIKPVKRGGGRRFYRPDDVALLAGIRHLLYGAGYTIRGVQRILKEKGLAHVQGLVLSPAYDSSASVAAVSEALELHDTPIQRSLFNEPEFSKFNPPDISVVISEDIDVKMANKGEEALGHLENIEKSLSEKIPFISDFSSSHVTHSTDTPQGPSVDARAATVSAAYTALTSANMPLHPREGFVRAEEMRIMETEGAHATSDGLSGSLASRYSPGPLGTGATRQPSKVSPELEAADNNNADYIIQPQYRLTTGTRENLLAVLEELRECRRLLGGALNRQLD